MTDMTNAEAAEILSVVKIRVLANPDDVGPIISALARAIAVLQRPVVTREEIAKLINSIAFEWADEEVDAIVDLLEGRL